jgi:hypothetical protein
MDWRASPFHKENRRLLAEVTSEERLYQWVRHSFLQKLKILALDLESTLRCMLLSDRERSDKTSDDHSGSSGEDWHLSLYHSLL